MPEETCLTEVVFSNTALDIWLGKDLADHIVVRDLIGFTNFNLPFL